MIGIDFGGTKIKAASVREQELVRFRSIDTRAAEDPAKILDDLAALARALEPSPESVGLAIPGEVDAGGRCWRLPNVPGFEGVEIARELGARLGGARVVVENDATTAALAESLYGHGRQYESFLLITLGTGIGGGLVLDGRVRPGAHGFAGEFGHLLIESGPGAARCGCGLTGCVEAYAGTRALLARYRAAGGAAENVRDIAEAARAGGEAARAVFEAMGEAIGTGLVAVQNLLDLDAVIFTGGISAASDLILPGVRAGLRRRRFAAPLGEVPLLVSAVGAHAGVIGAAHLTRLPAPIPRRADHPPAVSSVP
ncbi:MAG: ROK family protein [Sorangiineae bacterium]|nr:ROK family protein [Polyangiaceae bacterium]MEB2324328.1 ROK family protein [Sorangiineae bacterium]